MNTHNFLTIIFLLAVPFTDAQQPTAYIPNSPTQNPPITALCTPPPGATCAPSNQTSSTTTPHFSPTWPATLRPPTSAYKVLPSLLSSLQSTWSSSPTFPSLLSAIYVAAPSPAQLSLAVSGYNWDIIVQAPWYGSVGQQWRDVVTRQEEVLQGAFDGVMEGNGTVENGGIGRGERARGMDWVIVAWMLVFVGWIAGVGLL